MTEKKSLVFRIKSANTKSDFILVDGNVKAQLVDDFLEREVIHCHRMDWAAESMDFNPIEHVCDAQEKDGVAMSTLIELFWT